MKKKNVLPYLFFIFLSLAVGLLSSLAVQKGLPVYQELQKPVFSPPAYLFPIVWTLLYILMGIGAARVWVKSDPGPERYRSMFIFGLQLALNFFWSIWFFGAQAYLFAFFWLLALIFSIILMIISFYRQDRLAGLLQIPYLLWCCFAAFLNFSLWLLNI